MRTISATCRTLLPPREQHFATDRAEAGRQQPAHRGSVARGDRGEDRAAGGHERSRRERESPPEAAVAGSGLHLERALQSSGEAAADDEHPELLGVGEDLELHAVARRALHAVMTLEIVAR